MKRILCLLLLLLMTVGMAGCFEKEPPANDPTQQEEWQPSAPEVRDLSKLLTADEVSNAVGTEVSDGVLHEEGTVLLFTAQNYGLQVSLLVEEPEIGATEYLEVLKAQYAEGMLAEAPNLGDKAYWCAETGELLLSDGENLISVNVVCETMEAERRLVAARQLATLVLERV